MKGLISWLIVAAIGFVLMAFSYFNYQYDSGSNPWKDAFIYIGEGQPHSEAEELEYVTCPIRLLPMPLRAGSFAPIARNFGQHVEQAYRVSFQEKVVLYSDMASDFTDQMLEWGRMPSPGAGEVVAGFSVTSKDNITVKDRTLKVVGQFKKAVGLFGDSYLIEDNDTARELFNLDDEAVRQAHILRLPKEQLSDTQKGEQLKKLFPKSEFTMYYPKIRTEPGAYYLYMAGFSLLLLGGCLVFFKLYCLLAEKLGSKWLLTPLAAIRKYKHLFLALHLIYFGAVVLMMLVAYSLPELQFSLLSGIRSQVVDEGSGPLAVAGRAYMSKNILRAALTTFLINFPLGSLAVITLPSLILPGAGVLLLGIRAISWGVLLAPSYVNLSGMMLPHSLTLLIEGHAYVIAGFFGVLVLVYLFRKAEGPGIARRYGRALLLNLKGNLLVAIVLVIAAIYEAIEVILAMT
jgi:hypothetical protein